VAFKETQKLLPTTVEANMQYGFSVDIDGSYAIVGNPYQDAADRGEIYFYKRNDNGLWEEISINTTVINNTAMGYSTAIHKNLAVVGGIGYSNCKGRIFLFNSDDGWSSTFAASEPGLADDSQFGFSVDIYNRWVVAGSNISDNNKGSIRIFKVIENPVPAVPQVLYGFSEVTDSPFTIFNPQEGDFFGSSVAIYEDWIAVGATGSQNTGAVYIYQKDENDEWSIFEILLPSDGVNNDQFGYSVSLFGNNLAVGARSKTSALGDQFAGTVYLFTYSGGSWQEVNKFEPINDDNETNYFGTSVDMDDNYIAIGSPGADGSIGQIDLLYKYRNWERKILSYSGGTANDKFGNSVGVSQNFAIGGMPNNDEIATDAGAALIFEDPETRIRLAQEFNVDKSYLPTKASLYLKRVGKTDFEYWNIYNDR